MMARTVTLTLVLAAGSAVTPAHAADCTSTTAIAQIAFTFIGDSAVVNCFNGTEQISRVPDIANCSAPCHAQVIQFAQDLGSVLTQQNCTLDLTLIPAGIIPPTFVDPLRALADGGTNLTGLALQAEVAALQAQCQHGNATNVCNTTQGQQIADDLGQYGSVAMCLQQSVPNTSITAAPAIRACNTPCHNDTIAMLNRLSADLKTQNCSLALSSLPSAAQNNPNITTIVNALSNTSVEGHTVEADAFLLSSSCATNSSTDHCAYQMNQLMSGSPSAQHNVCVLLVKGAFGACYCEYVQQQQVANKSFYSAQALSNLYCQGDRVPNACYSANGDCASGGNTSYPTCVSGGNSSNNHHPDNGGSSGGHDSSQMDAIIISVVLVVSLFLAVFGSLMYGRMTSMTKLEALHALHRLDNDDDDELLAVLDDVGVTESHLNLKNPVYEGEDDDFAPSAGEDHSHIYS
eukprot:m.208771 g.208771  ORF g.208771 m.208771 type:complete len:461 (+) comp24241_c0_seq1:256-1638(+)